jgi:hypothetical protein
MHFFLHLVKDLYLPFAPQLSSTKGMIEYMHFLSGSAAALKSILSTFPMNVRPKKANQMKHYLIERKHEGRHLTLVFA